MSNTNENTAKNTKNGFKRATGLLVIEVVNSNANGDPDNESMPRQRSNGLGEISPVSFKRKLRDLIEDHESVFFGTLPEKFKGDENRIKYQIMESRSNTVKQLNQEKSIHKDSGEEIKSDKYTESVFARNYWDGRVFGNTILEKNQKGDDSEKKSKSTKSEDQKSTEAKENPKKFIKTGVVQFGMGISLAPVDIRVHTNTRKMPTEEDKGSGMAPLAYRVVEHGVYCMPFYVNPNYANNTGCTADDIELLKLLIPHAYDLNRSAIRPDVRIRHAWYIEHTDILCSCPEYLLTEALTPKKLGKANEPSTSWADYDDVTKLPDDLLARVDSCVDLMNP